MQKREFVGLLGASAVALSLPIEAQQMGDDRVVDVPQYRVIDLQRGQDRMQIDIATPAGIKAAAWLMRDIRANYVGRPHPNLLQLLAWLQAVVAAHGAQEVLIVTSGARVKQTNNAIEGAADNSRHIPALNTSIFAAVDLQPTRFNLATIAHIVAQAKFGGVGEYANHLHVDFGRVARWSTTKP